MTPSLIGRDFLGETAAPARAGAKAADPPRIETMFQVEFVYEKITWLYTTGSSRLDSDDWLR